MVSQNGTNKNILSDFVDIYTDIIIHCKFSNFYSMMPKLWAYYKNLSGCNFVGIFKLCEP